jgi:hypothetical protein
MSHSDDVQAQQHTGGAPGWILLGQAPAKRFQFPMAVGGTGQAPLGRRRLVRLLAVNTALGDSNITYLRVEAGTH